MNKEKTPLEALGIIGHFLVKGKMDNGEDCSFLISDLDEYDIIENSHLLEEDKPAKSKDLNDIQDLKSAFISHCKELGCEENYIKVCENKFSNIEKELKTNKKKLNLIGEVLVDVLKGNYADVNTAIDEIREVLCYYE